MTDQNTDICGELTEQGEICTLVAGWGRDAEDGPCRWHEDTTSLPRLWTEDRIETIYEALDDVPSLKHAAGEAGVGYRTVQEWKQRGRDLEAELSEADLEHDDNARRLVAFSHGVNARTKGGVRSLLSSAIEYAHEREDPDAILRIIQQIEGDDGAVDDLEDDAGPLASIPDDDQLEELLADHE